MTAAEARRRAESNKAAQAINEIHDVMQDIEAAVKDGKIMTYHYNALSQETIDFLEREPNFYKIKRVSHWKSGDYYEIYW